MRSLRAAFSKFLKSKPTNSIGPWSGSLGTDWVAPMPQVKPPKGHALEELELRKNNPAVRDAWEQYQTVLKLARK